MKITFYEQSAFTVESDDITIAVDCGSYTSQQSLASIGKPQTSLVSHIHPDHFSQEILQQLEAPIYTVKQVAETITDTSLSVSTLAVGETTAITNTSFQLTATASDHGPKARQPLENAGFIIRNSKHSIYFLGDMAISTPAPSDAYDVVLIPVGNKGYVFDPAEAVEHIKKIGWQGLTIPLHYHNDFSDPESGRKFAELAQGICKVHVVEVGESIIL